MRLKLARSSPLVVGLATGLFFGLFMAIFMGLTRASWPAAFIGGAVGGAFFGTFMGPLMSRMNRRVLGELVDLPEADLRNVVEASNRGAVPNDPRSRAAAFELAQRRHAETMRTRRQSLVVFGVFLVLTVALALSQSPWWWLGVAFWAAALLMLVLIPRHQRRRIELLGRGG